MGKTGNELLAAKLEAMCCNAPRHSCHLSGECECMILREAARKLLLKSNESNWISRLFRRR